MRAQQPLLNPKILLVLFTLLFSTSIAFASQIELVYWSDAQAKNLPEVVEIDGRSYETGGAGQLAGLLSQIRSTNPEALIINAGNQFGGTPACVLSKGETAVEVLNLTGIDVFVPGYHDFDMGWKVLSEAMEDAEFDVLLANGINPENGKNLFLPHKIFSLAGLEVGVIGVLPSNFSKTLVLDREEGLQVADQVLQVSEFCGIFADSLDALVAVSQGTWNTDSTLAAEVDGLDVIISSGTSGVMEKPRVVNNTLIVSCSDKGRRIGRLTLEIDNGNLLNYDNKIVRVVKGISPVDEDLHEYALNINRKYAEKLQNTIGRLETDWNYEPNAPCNLAQWMVDALHLVDPNTNLALINNGNLGKGLKRGMIREIDIWQILPYENSVMVFELSGPALRFVVQREIDLYNQGRQEYLTWSGLQIVTENDSLVSLKVRGREVGKLDAFSVITTGYLWDNFHEYTGLFQFPERRPIFKFPETNQREFIINVIKQRKVITAPYTERWIRH